MKGNEKEYYLFVGKEKIYVSEEVYKAYWQETNRERYLKRIDKENKLGYFSEFIPKNCDRNIKSEYEDKCVDVEKLVAVKIQIEALEEALGELNIEEREIIQALFFDETSQRDLAKKMNVSLATIFRRKEKTLKKLKEILKEWK